LAASEKQSVEEIQTLLFEFKDSPVSVQNQEGSVVGGSPRSADDSSTLNNIANVVAKHGGSSAMTRSRSRNSSSLHIGLSQKNLRSRTKQTRSSTSNAETLLAAFVTTNAAEAFMRDSCDLLTRWQQGSAERSIVFKHNDAAFILKGRDDIEELITRLRRM
jgi:hypothetical protein